MMKYMCVFYVLFISFLTAYSEVVTIRDPVYRDDSIEIVCESKKPVTWYDSWQNVPLLFQAAGISSDTYGTAKYFTAGKFLNGSYNITHAISQDGFIHSAILVLDQVKNAASYYCVSLENTPHSPHDILFGLDPEANRIDVFAKVPRVLQIKHPIRVTDHCPVYIPCLKNRDGNGNQQLRYGWKTMKVITNKLLPYILSNEELQNDSQEYICEHDDADKTTIKIQVDRIAPSTCNYGKTIKSKTGDIAIEGGSIELECVNYVFYSYETWFEWKLPVTSTAKSENRIIIKDGLLVVQNVTATDIGEYTCTFFTKPSKQNKSISNTITITRLKKAPFIDIKIFQNQTIMNQTLDETKPDGMWQIHYVSSSPLEAFWYDNNGTEINWTQNMDNIETDKFVTVHDPDARIIILRINYASLWDLGNYTLKLRMGETVESRTFQLFVERKPQIIGIEEIESNDWKCTVQGYPESIIHWKACKKDVCQDITSDSSSISPITQTSILRYDVVEKDIENIFCVAKYNGMHAVKESYHIDRSHVVQVIGYVVLLIIIVSLVIAVYNREKIRWWYNRPAYEISRDEFEIIRNLDKGGFGQVALAKLRNGTEVAVKAPKNIGDDKQLESLKKEINITWNMETHVNIVTFVGATTKLRGEIFLLYEYCPGGSLLEFIKRNRSNFKSQIRKDDYRILWRTDGELRRSSNSSLSSMYDGVSEDNEKSLMISGYTEMSIKPKHNSTDSMRMKDHINSDGGDGQYIDPGTDAIEMIASSRHDDYDERDISHDNKQYMSRPPSELNVVISNEDTNDIIDDSPPAEEISTIDLLCWLYQIAVGMKFLADKGIIHRDLAARNVLIDRGNIIKICDFGLARSVDLEDNDPVYTSTNGVCAFRWSAPEALFNKKFSTETDVWSFGVTAWEIFTLGKEPYSNLSIEQLKVHLNNRGRLEQPDQATPAIYDIMCTTWLEPEDRPKFDEIITAIVALDGSTDFEAKLKEPYNNVESQIASASRISRIYSNMRDKLCHFRT